MALNSLDMQLPFCCRLWSLWLTLSDSDQPIAIALQCSGYFFQFAFATTGEEIAAKHFPVDIPGRLGLNASEHLFQLSP